MFSPEEKARDWIASKRWPNGPHFPHCGTTNIQCNIKHPTIAHRYWECKGKPMFSVKTGTVMERSNIKCREWAVGIYLFSANLKGISFMKRHRSLGMSQKSAWYMMHRFRKAYEAKIGPFAGPVEADEIFMGGREGNKHGKDRLRAGHGTAGKECQGPGNQPGRG
ncbi:MAG: IS1595 family transposase [Aestuariivita sp.]|nr:IS1595 family transposase [Aestuariivita sp.]MCY4348143.1 IS1595 family transposase [Aestuariivita sp.]